jgi:hypothetical protein
MNGFATYCESSRVTVKTCRSQNSFGSSELLHRSSNAARFMRNETFDVRVRKAAIRRSVACRDGRYDQEVASIFERLERRCDGATVILELGTRGHKYNGSRIVLAQPRRLWYRRLPRARPYHDER